MRYALLRLQSQNRQPVEAIPIAGSTPSTISRSASQINQYVRRYLQSPRRDQIEAGQIEKVRHTNANPMAPATIAIVIVTVTARGNRAITASVRDSQTTTEIATAKGTQDAGLAAEVIAAPAIIERTSAANVGNGESATIAGQRPTA